MILGIFHCSPIFLELTLHWQKTQICYILMFQGAKRRPNDLKIYEHQFYEGRRLGSEAQKGMAHAARFLGRMGPTFWSLVAPLPSIFSPMTLSRPKTDYKNSPPM